MSEIFLSLLTDPFRALSFMVSWGRFTYVVALLAPLGFLPLLSPLDLLPALPSLVVNLQSRDPVLFHHRAQYTVFVLPFLVLASISGYRRLARWTSSAAGARGARFSPSTALALAVLLSLALTSRTLNDLGVSKWRLDDRQRIAHSVMARIPPDAGVSTWERFVPHLALRPKVFVFPLGLEASDYVLLDFAAYPQQGIPGVMLDRQGDTVVLRSEGIEHRYAVVTDEAQYLLLRRTAPRSLRETLAREAWARSERQERRRPG